MQHAFSSNLLLEQPAQAHQSITQSTTSSAPRNAQPCSINTHSHIEAHTTSTKNSGLSVNRRTDNAIHRYVHPTHHTIQMRSVILSSHPAQHQMKHSYQCSPHCYPTMIHGSCYSMTDPQGLADHHDAFTCFLSTPHDDGAKG